MVMSPISTPDSPIDDSLSLWPLSPVDQTAFSIPIFSNDQYAPGEVDAISLQTSDATQLQLCYISGSSDPYLVLDVDTDTDCNNVDLHYVAPP